MKKKDPVKEEYLILCKAYGIKPYSGVDIKEAMRNHKRDSIEFAEHINTLLSNSVQ